LQSIFKRLEKKYLITREQGAVIRNVLSRHMTPDDFGEYLVQNLYYDTENWDIIRASIENPIYKEKLRLRCYGIPNQAANLFLELKKKYKGIVYKRRVSIPIKEFSSRTVRDIVSDEPSQIACELDFYLTNNPVTEKIYISYVRSAFAGVEDDGLRVTFDTDIRYRLDCLDYLHPDNGRLVLPPDNMLMEIKTLGGMPLWMSRILCDNKIFPTSFSKYGACYNDIVLRPPESKTERLVVVSA